MSWIPPRVSREEAERAAKYAVLREEHELRDRLAQAAMVAAIAADSGRVLRSDLVVQAATIFYALADAMLAARRER
jgi:hypothetical protein